MTEVHHRDHRIVLTDQYGISYSHPADAVLSTAVPDPRIFTTACPDNRGADGGTTLPYYPIWAVLIIAFDLFVIWAVTAHGRDITMVNDR